MGCTCTIDALEGNGALATGAVAEFGISTDGVLNVCLGVRGYPKKHTVGACPFPLTVPIRFQTSGAGSFERLRISSVLTVGGREYALKLKRLAGSVNADGQRTAAPVDAEGKWLNNEWY